MNEFNNIEFPADFDDLSKYAPSLDRLRAKGEGFVLPENYFEESSSIIEAHSVIPTDEGFIVPQHYFEQLAGKIISLAGISGITDKEGFTLSENYFEKFADDVVSNAELHSLSDKDGFEIPSTYFSDFDSELNTKIALDNLKQDEGFELPEHYFDKFTDRITAQASLEDAIEKQSAVPEGYFDSLADRIAARIKAEETTIVPEKGRVIVFSEVLKRYARPAAIAASAALLIAVAFWFMNREVTPDQKQFAVIDTTHTLDPAKPDTVLLKLAPEKNHVAQEKIVPVNVPKRVNLHPNDNVQLVKNDIMDQSDLIDVNAVADFLDSNSDMDLDQQQITDPTLDADAVNEVIDVTDLLDGVNNK